MFIGLLIKDNNNGIFNINIELDTLYRDNILYLGLKSLKNTLISPLIFIFIEYFNY